MLGMGEGGGIIRYFEEYSQFLANPVSKGGQENIHGYYIPVYSRISTDILRVFTAGAATVPSISLPTQKLARWASAGHQIFDIIILINRNCSDITI